MHTWRNRMFSSPAGGAGQAVSVRCLGAVVTAFLIWVDTPRDAVMPVNGRAESDRITKSAPVPILPVHIAPTLMSLIEAPFPND